jgi:hypothetical protein
MTSKMIALKFRLARSRLVNGRDTKPTRFAAPRVKRGAR